MTKASQALERLTAAETEFNSALRDVWGTGAKIEVDVIENQLITRPFPVPIVATKVFRQEY
jgi:hypothetical protein